MNLQQKIDLLERLEGATLQSLHRLQEHASCPVQLGSIRTAIEALKSEVGAEVLPARLTWHEVLDATRHPGLNDLANATKVGRQAGYRYVTWNDRVYPSNLDWHVFLKDRQGPTLAEVGLVDPPKPAPKANCEHNDSMHASQMHLWCRRCGALRGPNGWMLPHEVP